MERVREGALCTHRIQSSLSVMLGLKGVHEYGSLQ
jgi:hypothetical protein